MHIFWFFARMRLHERTVKESIVDMQQLLKDKARDLLQVLSGHCTEQIQQLETSKDALVNKRDSFQDVSS